MCGIVGGNWYKNKDQVFYSLEKIIHRGRDHSGVYDYNGFYLGHNRLSIQDTSNTANQPMLNDTGDIAIVYNGELWEGWKNLQEQYLPNYKFRSTSDTEFILKLYEELGEESFKLLDGMFSFAILDQKKNLVYLVRDWIGKLPFYYSVDYLGRLIFASEVKAFSHMFENRIQAEESISIVPPATYLKYDIKKQTLESNKYYNFPYSDSPGGIYEITDPEDVIIENIRSLLTKAVKKRLISDVPICTLVSGGIDSIITTYLIKQQIPDVKGFVVSIGDTGKKDDLYHARLAANYMNIPLDEVVLNDDTFMNYLDKTIYAIEDYRWTQLSTAIVQLPLAEEIGRQGYKVALGGEGSDEVFASYADIMAFHYTDVAYHKKRLQIIEEEHLTNLRRTNCAMLYGGTVEMRSPFLDRDFVEYAANIPPKYKRISGWGEKPLLRKAFHGLIPDEITFRQKIPTGLGAHSQEKVKGLNSIDKDLYKNKLYSLLFGTDKAQKLNQFDIKDNNIDRDKTIELLKKEDKQFKKDKDTFKLF